MISPLLICFSHFNSQPHKEADNVAAFYHTHTDEFQLTASQGG